MPPVVRRAVLARAPLAGFFAPADAEARLAFAAGARLAGLAAVLAVREFDDARFGVLAVAVPRRAGFLGAVL